MYAGYELDVRPPAGLRGYNAKALSEELSVDTGDKTRVQQSFGPDVDVNTIMRRNGITGSLPFAEHTGVYGDFTGIEDYDSALERVNGAQERFMRLPAAVREKFNNDPGVLIRKANEMEPDAFAHEFVVADAVEPVVPPA